MWKFKSSFSDSKSFTLPITLYKSLSISLSLFDILTVSPSFSPLPAETLLLHQCPEQMSSGGKTKARSYNVICCSFNWEPRCRLNTISPLYAQFSFRNFYYHCHIKYMVQESFGDDQINYECCFYFIYTIWKGINVL